MLSVFSAGSQTSSQISEIISCIIQEYQLEGKVQHIVTDNGLHFVKGVKDYFHNKASDTSVVVTETGKLMRRVCELFYLNNHSLLETEDDNLEASELLVEAEADTGYVELELDSQSEELFNILNTPVLDTTLTYHIWLPAHIWCASHTLNLLAKADVETVLKSCSLLFRSRFDKSMKKVQDIWNKCGRVTKSAEICDSVLGNFFPFVLEIPLGKYLIFYS